MKAKKNILTLIATVLLLGLTLTAVACHQAPEQEPEDTQKPAVTTPATSEKDTDQSPTPEETDNEETDNENTNTEEADTSDSETEGSTDNEIQEAPDMTGTEPIYIFSKNDKVLGASSLQKPADSDLISTYEQYVALYGEETGIDEAFFETHTLRLVHTATHSGSTRYAVDSVALVDGTIKVEVIEQLAAISTRDLQYWFVFIAVEKDMAETPVEVNITSIQLT